MEKVIKVENLKVYFESKKKNKGDSADSKVRAVDGVSFEIEKGEILAVVGESGSGKTTLGKAMINVIPATEGKIIYRGKDITDVKGQEMQKMRQKLQMVFQDPYEALDPRQNAYQTLKEPLQIHMKNMKSEDIDRKIHNYLDSVGLHPATTMSERYPHHLSGGQRQRLSIAATMILEPEFVVADEPVSMLDVSIRAEILKLMLDLKGDKDLTYLFITHDLSLAWMIADRIAVFYLGKMVEIGPAEDVVHEALHPYSNALVSVLPSMDERAKSKERHVLTGETPSPTNIPSGCRFHTRCWLYERKGNPEICKSEEPKLCKCGDRREVACHFVKDMEALNVLRHKSTTY